MARTTLAAFTLSLDQITIPEPCHAAWDEMAPENAAGTRRHCDLCSLSVVDLRGESQQAALRLAGEAAAGGRVCVRFARDHRGRVMTREAYSPRHRLRRAGYSTMELLMAGVVVMGSLGASAVATQHRVRLVQAWQNLSDAVTGWVRPTPPAVMGGEMWVPATPTPGQAFPAAATDAGCDAG